MTFTIDSENNITAHGTPEEAAATTATPFDSFTNEQELAELAAQWPADRLVAIWNSLPGVVALKSLPDRKGAKDLWAKRIWARVQGLGDAAKPEPEAAKPEAAPAKQKGDNKAAGRAQSAKGAPVKGKSAPQGKKAAPAPKPAGVRGGSKTAQVIEMLQRAKGATISEIMDKMGWQRHTVRGFMAGAMKKAGFTVESFKPEGGERSYRLPK